MRDAIKTHDPAVVVVNAGAPVLLPWRDEVPTVLLAWFPGQEGGTAISEILFGDINPSGKLPYTIGKSLNDYGTGAQILYHANGLVPQQNFSDGVDRTRHD